jgi:hypothetical protein
VGATNRACDAALPKITEYLQHSRVAQWATNGKLPDVFKFVANAIRETAEKLAPGKLKRALDEKFDELKSLLQKIRPLLPPTLCERVDDLIKLINEKRHAIGGAVQQFSQPVRTVLKVIAKRLDDHAWRADIYRTNRGWIAPISQAGSARLINAKPPKWVKKRPKKLKYPPLKMEDPDIQSMMRENKNHPPLTSSQIATFSSIRGGMRADIITGPTKLYRIVDPSNEVAGMFWISEAEFKAIKNRDEWRSKFAVKPEWNQNGWFVEYEVRHGETLSVWRGPAASQKLDGTDYYLEGGGEQIVFFPFSRDEMVQALPRIDRETGQPILRRSGDPDCDVEMTDVTGQMVSTKLRSKITDVHIKGPIETGWGATDYAPEEAKRILLTVPKTP